MDHILLPAMRSRNSHCREKELTAVIRTESLKEEETRRSIGDPFGNGGNMIRNIRERELNEIYA